MSKARCRNEQDDEEAHLFDPIKLCNAPFEEAIGRRCRRYNLKCVRGADVRANLKDIDTRDGKLSVLNRQLSSVHIGADYQRPLVLGVWCPMLESAINGESFIDVKPPRLVERVVYSDDDLSGIV